MTKNDVKTFGQLAVLARERAARSLRRNDPIAWAYWRETEKFAGLWPPNSTPDNPVDWVRSAKAFAEAARRELETGRPMDAALLYSRAKWVVILARNNGVTMSPKRTLVNMDWAKPLLSKEAV
jgi:hypothetical protein